MSTFGSYTGRSGLIHAPWDAAFRKHLHGLAGLGSFGNAPDPTLVRCWDEESREYESYNSSVIDNFNRRIKSLRVRYQGTVICPKPDPWGRHPIYDIYSTHDSDSLVPSPRGPKRPDWVGLARTGFSNNQSPLHIEGLGYFEDSDMTGFSTMNGGPGQSAYYGSYSIYDAEKAGYTRTHTPQGVAHKGVGAGAALYAALAVASIDAGFKGNYSIEGTRSRSAALLWKNARNPKAGPLATRAQAAIARSHDGRAEPARLDMGDWSHCEDKALDVSVVQSPCGPKTQVDCAAGEFFRDFYVNYDFINDAGLARWGLVVFNTPVIQGSGLRKSLRAGGRVPYAARSGWSNDDVKAAFGLPVAPTTLARQSVELQRRSRLLSDSGLELLSRAAIGPSLPMIVKLAAVLQGRSPDLAAAFLRREDIATVLAQTSAGRSIIAAHGAETPLSGLGRAAFNDVERAASRAHMNPLKLTLPKVSRATEAFVNNYPDEG